MSTKPPKDIKIRKLGGSSLRNKLIRIGLILIGLFVLFVVSMNLLLNYVLPVRGTSALGASGGLAYQLAIDKSHYSPGEPIRLRLVVRNSTEKMIALQFPTTQQYNFVVKHDLDFVFFHFPIDVWQSSYHIIPRPIPNTLNLRPGEVRTFTDVWNQKDARGEQVLPGRYIIEAYLDIAGQKTILELPARMQK